MKLYFQEVAFYINEKPSNSIEPKHKGVQSLKKYTSELYKNYLEDNKTEYEINYSFRSKKHEIGIAEHPKRALNTFEDIKMLCY